MIDHNDNVGLTRFDFYEHKHGNDVCCKYIVYRPMNGLYLTTLDSLLPRRTIFVSPDVRTHTTAQTLYDGDAGDECPKKTFWILGRYQAFLRLLLLCCRAQWV